MATLYIVSTPIGNLDDITIRAIKTLFSVDLIACEDTRRTVLLLSELRKRSANFNAMALKFAPQYIRFDNKQEQTQIPLLIEKLTHGKDIALVSDAGTPLISDPGYALVSEAIKRGISVVSIPGPTAAIAALTVSGLPTNRFMFLGYPPEKQSHRIKLFQDLSRNPPFSPSLSKRGLGGVNPCTVIFFCAPHKLHQTLNDMQSVLGNIDVVITRELTKIHEEVWRGTLSEALKHFLSPQGEFVLLLH